MTGFTYAFEVTVELPHYTSEFGAGYAEQRVEVRLATELVYETTTGTDYSEQEAADLAMRRVGTALHELVSR